MSYYTPIYQYDFEVVLALTCRHLNPVSSSPVRPRVTCPSFMTSFFIADIIFDKDRPALQSALQSPVIPPSQTPVPSSAPSPRK